MLRDTRILTGRSLRHILRSPDTIITTAVTPIAIMLLFVFVFGGAIDTGAQSSIDYMLPGILLITIASGIGSRSEGAPAFGIAFRSAERRSGHPRRPSIRSPERGPSTGPSPNLEASARRRSGCPT